MSPFRIIEPKGEKVPVIISVPHCGTEFPDEIKNHYKRELSERPDDTDWYVDKLYDFAPALGMTMITAVYSRWVIDLNRDPQSKPLYSDGRIITGLCPVTDFKGNPIYLDERNEVHPAEIERRLNDYYWPYHHQLQKLIDVLRQKFGVVLLWDCHSIRQFVPTIYREKFPDLILGDAERTSAGPGLINLAMDKLQGHDQRVAHNHPFKGGYITRNYGKPTQGIHALQLEMTKLNYMDDTETHYDPFRAEKIRRLLKETLTSLAEKISSS